MSQVSVKPQPSFILMIHSQLLYMMLCKQALAHRCYLQKYFYWQLCKTFESKHREAKVQQEK